MSFNVNRDIMVCTQFSESSMHGSDKRQMELGVRGAMNDLEAKQHVIGQPRPCCASIELIKQGTICSFVKASVAKNTAPKQSELQNYFQKSFAEECVGNITVTMRK